MKRLYARLVLALIRPALELAKPSANVRAGALDAAVVQAIDDEISKRNKPGGTNWRISNAAAGDRRYWHDRSKRGM